MLKITSPISPRTPDRPPKIGLAVAGGGPLGAIYELGALRAVDEAILGLKLHRLAVYVGVSSGSVITASLANQISTAQMSRIFMSTPDAEFKFHPEIFLKPALREYLNRAKAIPKVALELLTEAIQHPERLGQLESLEGISRLIPTGLFDNQAIEHFIAAVLAKPGRTNDFRALDTSLRVVAVDLETGQAVRFGEAGYDEVPISKAVQASAALPGLYPPVEINGRFFVDGALRRTLHASVALRQDIDFLIAVNPLVPFDAHLNHSTTSAKRMIQGGLPLVLSQTFRSLIQSRMQIGMTKYASDYPHAGLLLIEPNRNDERMFFTNVFSYASRTELIEHAYQTTRKELLDRYDTLQPLLQSYGLTLDRQALSEPRTFKDSLAAEPSYRSPIAHQLAQSLESLEQLIEA